MFRLLRPLGPGQANLFASARQMAARKMASTNPAQAAPKAKKPTGLKALAKQYGWTGTGVYLGLSMIDLPIFFLLVHSTGNEWIEKSEIQIRKWVGASTAVEDLYIAKAMNSDGGQYMAEFSVAYVIHKVFAVVRLPLTIALTPFVARKLGQWGFNVQRAVPAVDKAQLAKKVEAVVEKIKKE